MGGDAMENLNGNEKQEVILFDSDVYMNDEFYDRELIVNDLIYSIEKMAIKPRGHVEQWLLLYRTFCLDGNICNNGAYGYYSLKGERLAEEILNIEAYRIVLKSNKGKLQVNLYNQEGHYVCEVKYVFLSRSNYYNSVLEHESFSDKLEYIKKLPSVRTRKSE